MKFNVKKFVIILASIIACSFIIAGVIFYATGGVSAVSVSSSQISTSKTYEAEGIDRIMINTINTDIDIIPAVINDVDIDFYGNTRTNLARGIPELKTYLEDGTLTVNITYPRTLRIGLINLTQLQLDIYVPGDYSGEITVNTVSGNLDIRDLDLLGLDFQSTSGALSSDSVNAQEFKIDSASGDIMLKESSGLLDIITLSGDVTAILEEFSNDLRIKTISGEILIGIPEGTDFLFDLSSISGDISNEFGANISFADRGTMEGSVGEGAFKITADSTSGDIKIVKGEK